MRVLVTGGAGFIGKHVLEWLLSHGHDVLVVDDFSTGRPSHVPPGVPVKVADLTALGASDLIRILNQFEADGVVHLAAMHFIPDCMARPERTFDINTRVTHTLIEALASHPVKRFVLASTMDVYSTDDRVHTECETAAPANVYGLSKLLSEEILASGIRRGICRSAVALRLANVYGPDETNPHLIPDILDRIARPVEAELVTGYLGATRDFVFVEDVAAAFGRAVTVAPAGLHRLNVGTGRGIPVRLAVQILQDLLGDLRPLREEAARFRRFDRASLTPEVQAIEKLLGWRATRQIKAGLAETISTLQKREREARQAA